MPPLNKRKMADDLEKLKAKTAFYSGFALVLFVAYVIGAAFHFSAMTLLDLGKYLPGFAPPDQTHPFDFNQMLLDVMLTGTAVLPIMSAHYTFVYGAGSVPDVLRRIKKSNNKSDREHVKRYALSVLFKGLVIIAAGDVACICAHQVLQMFPFQVGLISWAFGAGAATLGFYLRTWFHANVEQKDATPSSPQIRGTHVNTFAQAKLNSALLLKKREEQ
jgi:uncharacterized BrkB/YihY/UPF0761 family membrane protein